MADKFNNLRGIGKENSQPTTHPQTQGNTGNAQPVRPVSTR